jgi:hypothetical protein
MNEQDADQRRIENAVTAWARSIFLAPRRFHELITNVERRDEVIDRVATQIVRREVREVRAATSERRSTRPRVDQVSIDPFVHTADTMKADSEHVTQCNACGASGMMRCNACRGTGNGPCPTCHGSGKQRSPKTGRPIQCKSCKTTGTAPCRNCAGNGSVHCDACFGSGHQLAWLTFHQSQRCELAVPENSPLVITHRQLREHRAVPPSELSTMTVLDEKTSEGALDLRMLAEQDRPIVRAQLARIDPRLERVQHQQFLKLAAIRRDVTFETGGARATLSLAGSELAGATTPEVLRPIRRRIYLWLALCLLVWIAGAALRGAVVGQAPYFGNARQATGWLIAAAIGCAIVAFGALLRAWRGGLRFHPVRRATKMWSAGVPVVLASIVIVGLVAHPSDTELQQALAVNDVARARMVIDALKERAGGSRDLLDAEDRVLLAEASNLHGDDRLKLLDAVAARKGAVAPRAAADASEQRLDHVRQLIGTQHPAEALAELDRSFSADHSIVIAEERARAHEAAKTACATASCQLGEALQANAARTTPERTAAIDQARARVLEALDSTHVATKPLLSRLQQLRQLRDAGAETAKLALLDADLQARAQAAIKLADTARAQVPLLTNELAIAEELLGPSTKNALGVPAIALDGVTLYLSLDKTGHCGGIYIVGDKAGNRAIASSTWPPDRLLSQAVGAVNATLPPSAGRSASQWYANGAPVMARWQDSSLVELRIGDATP